MRLCMFYVALMAWRVDAFRPDDDDAPAGDTANILEASKEAHVDEAVDSMAQAMCTPDEMEKMCESIQASRNQAEAREHKSMKKFKMGLVMNAVSAVSLGMSFSHDVSSATDAHGGTLPDGPDGLDSPAPDNNVDLPDADSDVTSAHDAVTEAQKSVHEASERVADTAGKLDDSREAVDAANARVAEAHNLVQDAPDPAQEMVSAHDQALAEPTAKFAEAQEQLDKAENEFNYFQSLDVGHHAEVANQLREAGEKLDAAKDSFQQASKALDTAYNNAPPLTVAEAQERLNDANEAVDKWQHKFELDQALLKKDPANMKVSQHLGTIVADHLEAARHTAAEAKEALEVAQEAADAGTVGVDASSGVVDAAREASEAATQAHEALDAAKEAAEAADNTNAALEAADKAATAAREAAESAHEAYEAAEAAGNAKDAAAALEAAKDAAKAAQDAEAAFSVANEGAKAAEHTAETLLKARQAIEDTAESGLEAAKQANAAFDAAKDASDAANNAGDLLDTTKGAADEALKLAGEHTHGWAEAADNAAQAADKAAEAAEHADAMVDATKEAADAAERAKEALELANEAAQKSHEALEAAKAVSPEAYHDALHEYHEAQTAVKEAMQASDYADKALENTNEAYEAAQQMSAAASGAAETAREAAQAASDNVKIGMLGGIVDAKTLKDEMSAQSNAGVVVPEHEGYPSCLKHDKRKKEFEEAEAKQKKVDSYLGWAGWVSGMVAVGSIGCLALSITGIGLTGGLAAVVLGHFMSMCGMHLFSAAALALGLGKTAMSYGSAHLNRQQKKMLEKEIFDHCNITVEINDTVEGNEDPSKACEKTVGSCWGWSGKCDTSRGEVECIRQLASWNPGWHCVCKPGYCSAYGQCVQASVAAKAVVDAEKAAAEEARELAVDGAAAKSSKGSDWTQDNRGCWCSKSVADGPRRRHKVKEIDGWTQDSWGCWCQKHVLGIGKDRRWTQDSRGCWCDNRGAVDGAQRDLTEIDGWMQDSWGCWCQKGASDALGGVVDPMRSNQLQYPSGWTKDAQGCFCQRRMANGARELDTRGFDPKQHSYGWVQVSKSCWCFGLRWEWKDHGYHYDHWKWKDDWMYYDGVPYQGWNYDSKGRWYEIEVVS
eukprot:TRINITY_DN17944_c0_g1_i1.p1 TRINITY_DN17944_c0_g1~~TRINITY_DN17944_c0_g1_i1.p1  ORF type:complete len:1124 (+),score=193.97 TRINITY_DN17944_c0_g1_i1:57-3428(+)